MKSLIIDNLCVKTKEGKEILNGVSLTVKQGEIHALMGPNGGGKSTLAQIIAGNPFYTISKGNIFIDKQKITKLSADKRARLGLFLGFQYPVEVPGVGFANFLRTAVNESRKKDDRISPLTFRNSLLEEAEKLSLAPEIVKRFLNEGFSGGEKKKAEILQLMFLKPKFAILDEPDSGLDVDSLKIIAKIIGKLKFAPGLLLITHYSRFFHYLKPDFVHILLGGQIVASGNASLAEKVEAKGYKFFRQ